MAQQPFNRIKQSPSNDTGGTAASACETFNKGCVPQQLSAAGGLSDGCVMNRTEDLDTNPAEACLPTGSVKGYAGAVLNGVTRSVAASTAATAGATGGAAASQAAATAGAGGIQKSGSTVKYSDAAKKSLDGLGNKCSAGRSSECCSSVGVSSPIRSMSDSGVSSGGSAAGGEEERGRGGGEGEMTACCLPSGCQKKEELIRVIEGEDAVKVICNNDSCTAGQWMHSSCFQIWEQQILSYLRTCGRARSWSEKQRMQNVWTKKGYDLAYKACDCSCGKGHLRKDLDHLAAVCRRQDERKGKKNRRKFLSTSSLGATSMGGTVRLGGGGGTFDMKSPPLRIRTSSLCSSSSTDGTPPITPSVYSNHHLTASLTPGGSAKQNGSSDLLPTSVHSAKGNMFCRRENLNVFKCLPHVKRNTVHVKTEDDGQYGNDEMRTFLLVNLSCLSVTRLSCVVCHTSLPVYDQYPLVDGIFFLSPAACYNTPPLVVPCSGYHPPKHKQDQEPFTVTKSHLYAVCIGCMDSSRVLMRCVGCRKSWPGMQFIMGSLYVYDVFAAMCCCERRLKCKSCGQLLMSVRDAQCRSYSDFSKRVRCRHCTADDYHFINQISAIYNVCPADTTDKSATSQSGVSSDHMRAEVTPGGGRVSWGGGEGSGGGGGDGSVSYYRSTSLDQSQPLEVRGECMNPVMRDLLNGPILGGLGVYATANGFGAKSREKSGGRGDEPRGYRVPPTGRPLALLPVPQYECMELRKYYILSMYATTWCSVLCLRFL